MVYYFAESLLAELFILVEILLLALIQDYDNGCDYDYDQDQDYDRDYDYDNAYDWDYNQCYDYDYDYDQKELLSTMSITLNNIGVAVLVHVTQSVNAAGTSFTNAPQIGQGLQSIC